MHIALRNKDMLILLLPATRSGFTPPHALPSTAPLSKSLSYKLPRQLLRFNSTQHCHSLNLLKSFSSPNLIFNNNHTGKTLASSPISAPYNSPVDDSDKAKLAQVAQRLANTSKIFKRFGSFGFWGQLVCTVVSAVILSFSIVITGGITSPATFFTTAGGIVAAFVSVFWSFGYIRLSDKLRKTANDPSKAPPRADVVRSLKNGIAINLLGMGATVLGMQATIGLLVAKALTTSANPFSQGISPGNNPIIALDVFLVQASANTLLSHFLGLVCSLELLRSVTLPPSGSVQTPKMA